MVLINSHTCQKKDGVEVMIVDDITWLNERHIESQLKYSNLREVTLKYPKYLRRQRQELQDFNKQLCRKFLRKCLQFK